jgi:hypothetical protein
MQLDVNKLFEESEVLDAETLEAERQDERLANPAPAPTRKSLDEQYAQAMEAERTDFPNHVRLRLLAEFDAGLDSLFSIMRDSKHMQSKTAATRTFFKLAYDYGVLVSDPVKKLMMDMEAELMNQTSGTEGRRED